MNNDIISLPLKDGVNSYDGTKGKPVKVLDLVAGSPRDPSHPVVVVLEVDPEIPEACSFTVAKVGKGAVAKDAGAFLEKLAGRYVYSSCFIAAKCLLLFAVLSLLALTGCGTPGKHGQVMSVTTWFSGLRVTATSASSQTPEIWAGIGKQTVFYAPTSTNGPVYVPKVGASFHAQQSAWNPLSSSATDNLITGDMSVGTNSEASAIVPKANRPPAAN